ncbi:MAG: glycoside hydrolase family 127 protein [Pirellulales bacterium]|nr:glycoside hydrolase family 127 protein [Pirellulales bacterium]
MAIRRAARRALIKSFLRNVVLAYFALSERGLAHAMADDAAVVLLTPFHQVDLHDEIWAPRIRLLQQRTLPHAFRNTSEALEGLRLCGEFLLNGGQSPPPPPHRFRDSDLYKVMEGAALMLKAEPNVDLEAQMDEIIDVVARAQKDDGYLYVAHITGAINEAEMGPRAYSYLLHSHELYNMGHLYEAAVAYAEATGKTSLLEIAEKNARHVQRVFFEGDPAYNDGRPVNQAPGHQEIELGLVKLHLHTGNRQYLDMAKRFLDIRGVTFIPDGRGIDAPEYAQQHQPVARQRKAVGHAVRACYMYAAMAEVDSLTGKNDYGAALDSIWHDIVDTKMHISGGLGAVPNIEGFGPSYVLPNRDAYLETCAGVGNFLFNMRMYLKYRDAMYVDVAETALYNNCLAGIGLDGASFFYPNPLDAPAGHAPRSSWFGTACCPSNLARLIPKIAGHMYATEPRRLSCLLYGSNDAELEIDGSPVALSQSTRYPLHGAVKLEVNPQAAQEFEIALRIPTWVGEQFVPGKLYRYADRNSASWTVSVNGKPVVPEVKRGFAVVARRWSPGDQVELDLPMPVRTNQCLERVESNQGRQAVSRGPLLFSAEEIDNGGDVARFFFAGAAPVDKATVMTIAEGPLAGLPQITLPAKERLPDGSRPVPLKLVPYFAWSNRDRGSMTTWIGTRAELAHVDLLRPEHLKFAGASASHTAEGNTVQAVRMKHTPQSSRDTSIRRWTSWPQRGQSQWVEIDLGEARAIRSVGAYFYDDNGGVQLPDAWHLSTPNDLGTWTPVAIYNTDSYSTSPDNYNTVRPAAPLTTSRLRIELTPRSESTCVGILSVNVETAD